jgi:hypothetical protein
MDRNAKARLMTLGRALMRRREKGKAYGPVTAKTLAVLEALAWTFHNAGTGLCFPSYDDRVAKAAGCARSTAQAAVATLEALGLLSWVNRLFVVASTEKRAGAGACCAGRSKILISKRFPRHTRRGTMGR